MASLNRRPRPPTPKPLPKTKPVLMKPITLGAVVKPVKEKPKPAATRPPIKVYGSPGQEGHPVRMGRPGKGPSMKRSRPRLRRV